MTLAIDKNIGELVAKSIRGEDISADIDKSFDTLSPMEREIIAREGLELLIMSVVADDPSLEMFKDENGKTSIRRAA